VRYQAKDVLVQQQKVARAEAFLGLHLGENAELSSFDVHVYAMASHPPDNERQRRCDRVV